LWLVGSEVSSFNPATREEVGVVDMMVGLRGKELKEVGVHTSRVKLAKLERLYDARCTMHDSFDFSMLASLHLALPKAS
jgi:hypothetical protein